MARSGAGALNRRVKFLAPVNADDGHGGTVTRWEHQFTVAARLQPKIGSEEVVAMRMQGLQPYILRVRSSADTRTVTTAWRVVNDRDATAYTIKSAANLDERDAYLDFVVVAGGDE